MWEARPSQGTSQVTAVVHPVSHPVRPGDEVLVAEVHDIVALESAARVLVTRCGTKFCAADARDAVRKTDWRALWRRPPPAAHSPVSMAEPPSRMASFITALNT